MSKTKVHDRIFDGDEFNGTYVAYDTTPSGCITPMVCDVDIHSLSETRLDELRAYRQMNRGQGKKLRPLREDAFHEEIFVILGPQLSTKRAIAALQRLAEFIRKDGLLTGKVEPDGDYYAESFDGKVYPS